MILLKLYALINLGAYLQTQVGVSCYIIIMQILRLVLLMQIICLAGIP